MGSIETGGPHDHTGAISAILYSGHLDWRRALFWRDCRACGFLRAYPRPGRSARRADTRPPAPDGHRGRCDLSAGDCDLGALGGGAAASRAAIGADHGGADVHLAILGE